MIRNSIPLIFLISLTATLLIPTTTHHVNFNTWSVLQDAENNPNRGSATATKAKIVDKDCRSRRVVTRSLLGADHSANLTAPSSATYTIAANTTVTVCSRNGKHCNTNSTSVSAPLSNPPGLPLSPPPSTSILSSPPISTPVSVSDKHKLRKRIVKVVIGVASVVMGGFMIFIIIGCFRYKSLTGPFKICWTTKSNVDIEAFLKNHGAPILRSYKLADVKKMTNYFKVNLGQGGFGAVYEGKLSDGSPVAVKMLNASKGNGEDLINEVASISRTSHVNVVQLLGFCLEGSQKALIYEFMANGSLDKFIYNKGLKTTASLSWDNLWQIAKGIAQGLEYLHKGCNTQILHFDIKPSNILLDENFCPKISDFGLAKLCPRKESTISMLDARGTMGYKAPEVSDRQLGRVSHKSDVYSYGMMLLEMVGGRKNINAEASHISEISFPHWAYKKLELGNDLRPDMEMTIEEHDISKRLAIVGLCCIQTSPNDRPTMSTVIDMLEGNMNSLEIPPIPKAF